MARPRNNLVDYVVYLLVRLVAMFIYMVPTGTVYAAGRRLGDLLWLVDRRHRQIATGQLRISFPDWSEDRIRQVARQSLRSLALMGIELLLTPRLITPQRWRQHLRLRDIGELLRLLLDNDTGAILLTGHFGNFEVAGYMLATLGFPTVSVARPLDNPYLNDFVTGVRERTGQSILIKKGASVSMDSVLEGRGILGFIADQDAGRKGVFVDFFGRPASTFRSIALMAAWHQVPIVVGYARRIGEDYCFEVGVHRIIRPHEWQGQADEVRWITQEYTRALEQIVRAAPEQYFWVHRRWKHRPDGTRAGGLGIA